MSSLDTVVLDLDGTLVDSVYVQTVCWHAAFREVGVTVASHAVHRALGMDEDRLVAHVAGEAVQRAMGEEIRRRHAHHLEHRLHEITPATGAVAMLEALRLQGLRLVLIGTEDADHLDALLDLVDGGAHLPAGVVSGTDATGGAPTSLLERALDAVDATPASAVLIAGVAWAARVASEAGVGCIGLLTGGLTEAELRDAGCGEVYDSPDHLAGELASSALLAGAGR